MVKGTPRKCYCLDCEHFECYSTMDIHGFCHRLNKELNGENKICKHFTKAVWSDCKP